MRASAITEHLFLEFLAGEDIRDITAYTSTIANQAGRNGQHAQKLRKPAVNNAVTISWVLPAKAITKVGAL